MKKLLIALLLLTILSSCKKETPVVPLIIYDMKDDYMEDFESRIKRNEESVPLDEHQVGKRHSRKIDSGKK